MRKSRFEQELSGELGAFWVKKANEELDEVRAELEAGEITIDENGVAYNCIGRVVMDDMAEKLEHVTSRIDREATTKARREENEKSFAEYREKMKNYKPSAEELYEMRCAFGAGTTVVDIITGQKIRL